MNKLNGFITAVILLVALVSAETLAQGTWAFKRVFYMQSGFTVPHGVAVTPDGKVWTCANVKTPDTLGTKTSMKSVYVLNPDGTIFKKIQTLTVAGVTDTLTVGARGIATGIDGNILYSAGSTLYKIDYKTYEGVSKASVGFSLTRPAQTDDGTIMVGPVLNGYPIRMYGPNLTLIGNVVDTTYQIARVIEVSGDGSDVYLGSTTGPGVILYHSNAGLLGPWVLTDTLVRGMAVEAMKLKGGKLWVSSVANGAGFTANSWYEYTFSSRKLTDSLAWDTTGFKYGTPRGIDFSVSGDTVYIVGSDGNAIQMFVKKSLVSVRQDDPTLPRGYALEQNYPNPFNPTTKIRFRIAETGLATLKVYDVMGREVATLVDETLTAGAYTTAFDGANLASGTYIYVLTSGGHRLTNKMLLLK